jgi:kynureninase
MPIIQYYTGQIFDAETLCKKSHQIGALFGLDLAHGTGNVPMHLHAWGVDFAVWCTYKYLNAGPGAVGGYYIRNGLDDGGRRLVGWWANDKESRFEMSPDFVPTKGARGYQHSNTNVLGSIPLLGTLELIDKAGFTALREKAIRLTAALDALLVASPFYLESVPKDNSTVGFRILTPPMPWRGTQISIFLHGALGIMPRVFGRMIDHGLVGDERQPNVIRLAPVTLYNTFTEVGRCVEILNEAMAAEK